MADRDELIAELKAEITKLKAILKDREEMIKSLEEVRAKL